MKKFELFFVYFEERHSEERLQKVGYIHIENSNPR